MKLERLHISVFLGIAVLIWLGVLLVQGTSVTWAHAQPFTAVVSALVGFGALFEHVLWRTPWLNGWFVKRPDLRGTWRVEIQSSYIRPETGERVPKVVCYMGVQQTLSKLRMHLMTPESESRFISNQVHPSQNGNGYQVIGVYANEPDVHLRGDRVSEIHQGAIVVETHGEDVRPDTLTAKYWTDRKTTGTMDFTGRVGQVFTRFEEAENAFATQSGATIQ